jgi:hypothetical protein
MGCRTTACLNLYSSLKEHLLHVTIKSILYLKNELSSVLDKFDCMHPWNSFLTLDGVVDRLMEDQVSDGIL